MKYGADWTIDLVREKLNADVRALLSLGLAFAAGTAPAAVEVRSERFHVVAETDAPAALQAVSHLEATAATLERLGFRLRRPDLPLSVLILNDQADLARYQKRSRGRAFAVVSEDRLLIAIAWDVPGDPWLALSHEYAHLTTDYAALPPWFREGIAEFLSAADHEGTRPRRPVGAVAALSARPWLPIIDWLNATDESAVVDHELFYAQSWLAVSALAEQTETAARDLHPQQLWDLTAQLGAAGVEAVMRDHLEVLQERPEPLALIPVAATNLAARVLEPWEEDAWKAELMRGVRGSAAAESLFQAIDQQAPGAPLVQAALGALAMERGRFDEAERRLRLAVLDEHATPQTHYRYALMLLGPSDGDSEQRGRLAAEHAERALELAPGYPAYLRTLAHAKTAAGEWNQAARALAELRKAPSWSATAAQDFQEVERSRWQALWEMPAPQLRAAAPEADPIDSVRPPIAPLREPHDYPWPPPGTQIMVGRIARVDCSSGEKVIMMRHPLFRIHFVESAKQPAKLHHPPLKWKTIPCDTYGWSVNIAYIPLRNRGPVKGEVRAILF